MMLSDFLFLHLYRKTRDLYAALEMENSVFRKCSIPADETWVCLTVESADVKQHACGGRLKSCQAPILDVVAQAPAIKLAASPTSSRKVTIHRAPPVGLTQPATYTRR